jgi:sugar phosphate isomerase/epimerase
LAELHSPQVKMVFDTYHLCQDSSVLYQLPAFIHQIAVVHLGDCKRPPSNEQNRCHLGAGQLPLRQAIQALQLAGYQGDYDVELMGEDIEACNYAELLAHSYDFFQDCMAKIVV